MVFFCLVFFSPQEYGNGGMKGIFSQKVLTSSNSSVQETFNLRACLPARQLCILQTAGAVRDFGPGCDT